MYAIANGGAVVFEALSAVSRAELIGRPIVDVDARTETVRLGAEQDMIFFRLKHIDGQRARNGQRLLQLGGNCGACRDSERHDSPSGLQVEGKL